MTIEVLMRTSAGVAIDRRFSALLESSMGWAPCSAWLTMPCRLRDTILRDTIDNEIMTLLGVVVWSPEATITVRRLALAVLGFTEFPESPTDDLIFAGHIVKRRGSVLLLRFTRFNSTSAGFSRLKEPLLSFIRLRE